MTEQIVVTVFPDGHSEARTVGVHGAKCLDAVPLLEALLDSSTQSSTYTADFLATHTERSETAVQEQLDG